MGHINRLVDSDLFQDNLQLQQYTYLDHMIP